MEKNIHDDRLDDFVKKSFEEYEENPATDMWERIEGGIMPPVEAPETFWYAWRGYRWQLAAAAVILLLVSRLVCVQFYYEEKLRLISGQLEQAAYDSAPETPPVAGNIAQNSSAQSLSSAIKSRSVIPAVPTPENPFVSPSTVNAISIDLSQPPAMAAIQTTDEQVRSTATTQASATPDTGSTIPTGIPADQNSRVAETNLPSQPDNFQTIGQKNTPLTYPGNDQPSSVNAPVKKHREPSGWYAGVFVSPHLMVDKPHQPKRPGSVVNPRQLYANRQERPQTSAEVSLRVGKKINARFALESGLGFRQLTRTTTHRPRFEYREGSSIPPTGGVESRSFDYDLNTYGGSASVSLRTEVSGNDIPAEHERVGARITCREQIQLVQVPVLGVARFGYNRMQAVIKAGVTGSILAKNVLQISAYRLENTKLQFRGSDGYSVQYNRPQHFILGYQVSAGAEFRVNRNLSVVAAPTFSGDFARNDPQRGKMPGQTSFGIQVGANWWF